MCVTLPNILVVVYVKEGQYRLMMRKTLVYVESIVKNLAHHITFTCIVIGRSIDD
jgi:hypothetical protein